MVQRESLGPQQQGTAMFTLNSPGFERESPIPRRYTCEGEDLSPPLEWLEPPSGTVSFALVVDDPDAPDPAAPRRIWVHWIRYDIPATVRTLGEGAGNRPPREGRELLTDGGTRGYHGPCPPIGTHRYYFRLFALDAMLGDLGEAATRADLDRAMARHVLATAVVMGTYRKEASR